MTTSYLYYAGIVVTTIGFIIFEMQQRKHKTKITENNHIKIDSNQVYVYTPNYKRILIECSFILIVWLFASADLFSRPVSNSIQLLFIYSTIIITLLFTIWVLPLLNLNHRKIAIDDNQIKVFSFLSKNSIDTNWDDLEYVEYFQKKDQFKLQEKKPNDFLTCIKVKHYCPENQLTIQMLFDANLSKRNKKLEIK